MRSSDPILAELERILNQQLAAEHLLRSEAHRCWSDALFDLACLSQAESVAAYNVMRWDLAVFFFKNQAVLLRGQATAGDADGARCKRWVCG